jgi:hypothetical protein
VPAQKQVILGSEREHHLDSVIQELADFALRGILGMGKKIDAGTDNRSDVGQPD